MDMTVVLPTAPVNIKWKEVKQSYLSLHFCFMVMNLDVFYEMILSMSNYFGDKQ